VPVTASIDRVHRVHSSVGRGTIQRIKDGGAGQGKTIAQLAAAAGISQSDLLDPGLPAKLRGELPVTPPSPNGGTPVPGVAHLMSLSLIDDLPVLQWGDLVVDAELPEQFKLAMIDNAMAPRAPAGTVVHFRRAKEAKQGSGVLVRDGAGNFYFRRLQQRTPSHWRAIAANEEAAGALDSITDALTIVAVMTALETDWSEGY
jgi:hypothetical protein